MKSVRHRCANILYMEPEKTSLTIDKVDKLENLKKITPLSKYLALALFVILPFVGGLIGYTYAPEKLIEVDKIVETEKEVETVKIVETDDDPNFVHMIYEVIPMDAKLKPAVDLLKRENELYVRAYWPLSAYQTIELIPGASAGSYEYLGAYYLKTDHWVYYIGSNMLDQVTGEDMRLSSADPDSFRVYYPNPDSYKGALGVDKDGVYYQNMKLEGIDPDEMITIDIEYALDIVMDTDTVWLPVGDCHIGYYEEGTLDQVENYSDPC